MPWNMTLAGATRTETEGQLGYSFGIYLASRLQDRRGGIETPVKRSGDAL